ncbi:LOW QUALITY PROTEIN: pleckstrin homology domain-containing family O member 2 [Sorex fumeus]|uniref:LOW QUALITY PROTEIN: pleckstrin homology domain-containing family O member 2 n=1 Tax=Sorex fumeus TaxID=62283 RepID=UPI0024AD77A9|nr:LOW QUALITY PROTEIN: pleckstrin homology domain-containing family O member 2 [Sorex fumeus]
MEEEDLKEGGEKPRGTRTADKAGWIKKSSGGFLGLWKDRYLLLCQAQLLVFENEDEQKCVETVELGSYEKCQDLRALLKRKHRFILLRSPGNKVSDIKFQAPSGEEKESWIRALNEGISRGKNKVFDEVKVDKTCALEHVTRDRVRGGQRRRPPTRVHLKEVANAASEGLTRLDLDVPDSAPPAAVPSDQGVAAPAREVLLPPMPPSKPSPATDWSHPGSRAESPAQERGPTPAPAASGANGESQEDSVAPAHKDSDPKQPPNRGDPEGDRLKVSWEEPAPGPGCEALEPKQGGQPPTPPPKILSERLRVSVEVSEPAPSAQTAETAETIAGPGQVAVNGVAEGQEPLQPPGTPNRPGTPTDMAPAGSMSPPQAEPPHPHPHPRCSSLGDLLAEGSRVPPERLFRAQLDVKVASEQTEKLLRRVAGGEPGAVDAEALLSQAVEQLRQATQVLQELRVAGERGQDGPGAPVLAEKRKELVTLYRRSVP